MDRSISFTRRDAEFFAERKVALLRRLVHERGSDLSQATVLDVGCGTGTTAQHLIGKVQTLHGVDLSAAMISEAKRAVPGAHFRSYGGKALPYASGSFDLVLAVCVVHHVPRADRLAFTSELNRVGRPGALIAIFEHNPINPLTRRAVNSCELDVGVRLLRPREVRQLLEAAGAQTVRTRYFLFTPFGGVIGSFVDSSLRRIPMGGQHVVTAQASPPALGARDQ